MIFEKKKKYIAMFLIQEQDNYDVLSRKRFNPDSNKVRYKKGKTHIIDVSKPIYSKGLRLYYFIEINQGQLSIGNNSNHSINPEIVDMVMSQSIIKQLTASLGAGFGMNWMSLLTGLAFGGLIGLIVGLFI